MYPVMLHSFGEIHVKMLHPCFLFSFSLKRSTLSRRWKPPMRTSGFEKRHSPSSFPFFLLSFSICPINEMNTRNSSASSRLFRGHSVELKAERDAVGALSYAWFPWRPQATTTLPTQREIKLLPDVDNGNLLLQEEDIICPITDACFGTFARTTLFVRVRA